MKEMTMYTISEEIAAPAHKVFSYICEDDKIKEWNSTFVENLYETEEDQICRPGATYKSVSKIGKKTYTADAVVLEHDPPYSTAVKGFTDQGEITTRYILDEHRIDDHIVTLLTVEVSMLPKNRYQKWMAKCFGWTSKLMMAEEFEHLKELLENPDGSSDLSEDKEQ